MADLIDRQALLEKVQYRLPIDSEKAEVIAVCVNVTRRIIEVEPGVDAVEVVRCKDCKHYKFGKHFTDIKFCQRLPLYAAKGGLNTADDDFCSHGERREAENNPSVGQRPTAPLTQGSLCAEHPGLLKGEADNADN